MNISTTGASADASCPSVLSETCIAWEAEGIKEVAKNISSDAVIYPNPSNGSFSLEVTNGKGIYKMAVYDVLGRIVLSRNIDFSLEQIVRFNLPEKGIYVVSLTGGTRPMTKKVVVQ